MLLRTSFTIRWCEQCKNCYRKCSDQHCPSTVCRVLCDMMLECLTVAQAQVGEELSQEDGAHYTMVPITQFKLMEPLSLVKSFLLLILPPLENVCPWIETCVFWICTNYFRYLAGNSGWPECCQERNRPDKCVIENYYENEEHYVRQTCSREIILFHFKWL